MLFEFFCKIFIVLDLRFITANPDEAKIWGEDTFAV